MHGARLPLVLLVVFAATGCDGPQSALDPAGRAAERIAGITLWMTIGFLALWVGVVALALYAPRVRELPEGGGGAFLVIAGGVVLPVTVLTLLLTFGLAEVPAMLAPAPDDRRPSITVEGRQWWWRVTYTVPGQEPIELANELHLPRGTRTNVRLQSPDVIHSFWVPSLAGKLDLIPGRLNRLALEPTRTGTFRGVCAEFCGESHARMNFLAVVHEPEDFDRWVADQAAPARPAPDGPARQGEAAFFARGCANCHKVRGTMARGTAGPDLTHVGSRRSLAAGTLPVSAESFGRWISGTELIKPGVHMPAFADLPRDELAAMAAYLAHLQ